MKLLAIDPGNEVSAMVLYDTSADTILRAAKDIPNETLLDWIASEEFDCGVIEMVASYGMAVGKEVFETVFWIGRFYEAIERTDADVRRLFRMDVKMHLCKNSRAKDGNIRQALIDRLGPVGTKKNPGPCYGLAGDMWAALGVAITFADGLTSEVA